MSHPRATASDLPAWRARPRLHRCSIIPEYLLRRLAQSHSTVAPDAHRTLVIDAERRAARARHLAAAGTADVLADLAPGRTGPSRLISDAGSSEVLPGRPVRREGEAATGDPAVNEAYDGLGHTWRLLHDELGRNSLDGQGLGLAASVHFGTRYDNAFWDGTQMVFGDGDGKVFGRFTASLDVIGHELTHGLTEYTAGLVYRNQPGALNESISDVFGSLVRQYALRQTAAEADWLIGADLLLPSVKGVALRSMLAPGTAYDDPVLGKDPQPGSMDAYVTTREDNGGVHLNSGIPNRAFALAARKIGGYAWSTAGRAWYDALTGDGIRADCDFVSFARLTVKAAGERFGADGVVVDAIRDAWSEVGVLPVTTSAGAGPSTPGIVTANPGRAAQGGSGGQGGQRGHGGQGAQGGRAAQDGHPSRRGTTAGGAGEGAGSDGSASGHAGHGEQSGGVGPDGDPSGDARRAPVPAADAQASGPPGDAPAVSGVVTVRRTGGVAGIAREQTVDLADLPHEEASRWAGLIADAGRHASTDQAPGRPDQFVYTVRCPELGLEVSLPADRAPASARQLLDGVFRTD